MKKFLIILISAIVGLFVLNGVIIFAVECWETANYNKNNGHTHTLRTYYDKTYHKQECSECHKVINEGAHVLDEEGECLICSAFSGNTEPVQYEAAGDHAKVVGCQKTNGRVRILPTYNGLPVTEIADKAFKESSLTGIVIPESVKSIGKAAFYDCLLLANAMLPDELHTIGDDAFLNCEPLTNVELPESLVKIGESAFFGCKALTNIRIPSKITAIEKETFKYCAKLASVELPNGLKTIGDEAFAYCDLLAVTLPDSLTGIGRSAFNECVSLTNICIPKNVEIIGNRAFNGCTKLASVELAEGISAVIEELAFRECPNLQYNVYENARYLGNETNPYLALMGKTGYDYESYEIHEDTKIIAALALSGMTKATKITLPDGVTVISASAFKDSASLTGVIIPQSVEYIGEKAFDSCGKLTFYCKAASQPDGWHEAWNNLNREVVWNY